MADHDSDWPSVTAVVVTRGRDELLRRALRSIALQQYGGSIEIVIVYDQCDIDEVEDVREIYGDVVSIVTVANQMSPGLAGGRNTGIALASGELIAFCDDDDEWLATKLDEQTRLWKRVPAAAGITTGMTVVTHESEIARIPAPLIVYDDFLTSRVGDIHPSSFLFRRADLLALPGGVDEGIPASYGEDYDLLLRLTKNGPIASVQKSLVVVHWDRVSYFAGKWAAMASGLCYLLEKHPELYSNPNNAARICGQIAFARAASGDRKSARMWTRRCLRHRSTEPRAWLTLATMTGLVGPDQIVSALNKRGRGI